MVILGDLVKKILVNRIGFWGFYFLLELQRWYWDSGSGIPILDIKYGKILQSGEEILELQGWKKYKSLAEKSWDSNGVSQHLNEGS